MPKSHFDQMFTNIIHSSREKCTPPPSRPTPGTCLILRNNLFFINNPPDVKLQILCKTLMRANPIKNGTQVLPDTNINEHIQCTKKGNEIPLSLQNLTNLLMPSHLEHLAEPVHELDIRSGVCPREGLCIHRTEIARYLQLMRVKHLRLYQLVQDRQHSIWAFPIAIRLWLVL